MAFMNHASTRVNKFLAGFTEDSVIAAARLVAGESQGPATDIAKAFDVLNKLKMAKIVRDAKDEADQLILAGLKMYADPSGDFKAFVPRSWMDETIKRLSAVEKSANAAYWSAATPAAKMSIATVREAYRIFQTAILTGLILPRPAYWTNIYVGNISQLLSEARAVDAARLAASPARDIIWASQRLADQTPMGKYVDSALDYMANKFDTDHPLGSLTNALVNESISKLMDPRLADDSAKISGTPYTMGDLRRMAVEEGVFTSFASSTDLANMVKRAELGSRGKLAKKLQAPMETWANFADTLEQRQRVGLFTDLIVNRGMDPEEAGKIVREAMYDWDYPMTKLEAATLQRIFMFYTFQRKAMGQAMRVLLDPYVRGKDDSLGDIMMQSSPALSAITGKKAYKTSYLMAMEEMLHQGRQAMIAPGEERRDGTIKGGTSPVYPWWNTRATNKIFLPNTPMSADRGANYTNSIGKKRGDPGITHKVLTMPSFTPIEMVNNWADIVGTMVAYGVSWGETPINVIRGKGMGEGVGRQDVGNMLTKHAVAMGGPVSEHAMEGVFANLGLIEDRNVYQNGGKAVTRLSDKKILQALNSIPGVAEMAGADSGLIWRDLEKEGDAWRTTPGILALYRGIPGLPNEINTYFGPMLENHAEGGAIHEGILETFLSAFGFKTYRYSPESVVEWDIKGIKKKVSTMRREEERRSGVKLKK